MAFLTAKDIIQNVKENQKTGSGKQLGVMGNGTRKDPNFLYTYGYYRGYSSQPELINFWPRDLDAAAFVNAAILTLIKNGSFEPLSVGEVRVIPGLLGDDGELPVRVRLLNPTERVKALEKYLTACDRRSPVMLVELPDFDGKFIDDPECDRQVAREIRRNAPFLVNDSNKTKKGFLN